MEQPESLNVQTDKQLLKVFLLFMFVFLIGAVFFHLVEKLSYIDAIYFAAMTLTTVGYGDIAPQTDAGKIFTAIYAFLGIGIFFGFAGILFQRARDRRIILHRNQPEEK
ncbi:MAG TPA: potassium channel family protein [Candidatus Saccharimonadales bacterium]|nr:potassium channel family protein [Candidatus Saccharimonadales bacterium]